MKSTHFFLSRLLPSVVGAATLAAVGMSGAQAASILCGDSSLGLRILEVDPASACIDAFTGNLGDGALEDLLDTFLTPPDTSTLVDRDTLTDAGGLELSIPGFAEGDTSGDWAILNSVWNTYDRVFLAFHFGGGGDTTASNPDSFIVELARRDTTGTWELTGDNAKLNGLSNIALLGSGEGTTEDDENGVPEPGMLFLMGAGLLGLGMARRRKSA